MELIDKCFVCLVVKKPKKCESCTSQYIFWTNCEKYMRKVYAKRSRTITKKASRGNIWGVLTVSLGNTYKIAHLLTPLQSNIFQRFTIGNLKCMICLLANEESVITRKIIHVSYLVIYWTALVNLFTCCTIQIILQVQKMFSH